MVVLLLLLLLLLLLADSVVPKANRKGRIEVVRKGARQNQSR